MQKKGVGVGRKQVWVAKKMSASLLRLWLAFFFLDKDLGLKMCFRVRYGKKENGTLPAHEKILDFKNLVLIAYRSLFSDLK